MTALYLVPQAYLQQWRRRAALAGGKQLPLTVSGLAARILKEGLIRYQEDGIKEEVALWQAVWENKEGLEFFAPIAHYPGFVQELRWLFRQIDSQEKILGALAARGRAELLLLHATYHRILEKQGILDGPGRLKKALGLTAQKVFLQEVKSVNLVGLGDLTPLENKFIRAFAGGRPLKTVRGSSFSPQIRVIRAPDPFQEVEMLGRALRLQLEQGTPLERIGVAFPNPAQYLPILLPVFQKLHLPLRVPAVNLGNTPLGKAFLALLVGELEGWHKHHLQLLTAPGWGFPFALSAPERRRLRWGPPLRGLPAWREYLGDQAGWVRILDLINQAAAGFQTQTVGAWGVWLGDFLKELVPERWLQPNSQVEQWAELAKAWAGLKKVAEGLRQCDWVLAPSQFAMLLRSLLHNFPIRPQRVFSEELQIVSVDQLGAHLYEHLYVGGLVEGEFPVHPHAHWLTKAKAEADGNKLYQLILAAAPHLHLYYPETDREGRLNLPAVLLPLAEKKEPPAQYQAPRPSLFLGRGILSDPHLTLAVQERILQEGLSVSQLNRYANCPYYFYCSFVLQLEPEEEAGLDLDRREEGLMLHRVLRDFWREYLEGPLPGLGEALLTMESKLVQEYEKIPGGLPLGTLRIFREFIREDLHLVQESGFRPRYLERGFENLIIATKAGAVKLRGFIDRIDVSSQGEFALYDYKTGSAPTLKEMVRGEDVQIAAYLLAAQNLMPQVRNIGAAYYLTKEKKRVGIFHGDYFRRLLIRKGEGCLEDDQFAEQLGFFQKTIAALLHKIFAGEFPIEPAQARMCSYCPYQGICRKEVFR